MFLLNESIKVKNNKLCNIYFHNDRLNNARRILFNAKDTWDLSNIITVPDLNPNEEYKCRINYGEKLGAVEFIPYVRKNIKYLKLVNANDFDYSFKYADRQFLDELRNKNINTSDTDILIVKAGYITDTSFSNIIFFDGVQWVTPSNPLLKGTKRALYLANKTIIEREIKTSDINKFLRARLINAMLDIEDNVEILTENIY